MQGYFSSRKAEDEGGLSPGEDDNAAGRKINRKDALDLGWFDYKEVNKEIPGTPGILHI